MRATAFLFEMRADGVVDVLRALERAAFFAAPPPYDAIVGGPDPYVYATLVAPASLPEPHRAAARALLGDPLPVADDGRAPYDPFELVIPCVRPGADDVDGVARAAQFRGRDLIVVEGMPPGFAALLERPGAFGAAHLAELRVFTETAPYFALLLARAGIERAFVAPLDDA